MERDEGDTVRQRREQKLTSPPQQPLSPPSQRPKRARPSPTLALFTASAVQAELVVPLALVAQPPPLRPLPPLERPLQPL
jgi:hypothetical protein